MPKADLVQIENSHMSSCFETQHSPVICYTEKDPQGMFKMKNMWIVANSVLVNNLVKNRIIITAVMPTMASLSFLINF